MAPQAVAGVIRRAMQPPDEFGRPDLGRVLVPELAALHAEDEAERFHVGSEIR